ncbi:hypothetical protein [Peribacillus acanthi]|uniref:hypothetical protein n=1 Tax=Peribacillus acanthi TaxID=2171554 RepID=UPI0013007066|nr:hypothetical protein [Peribacillus acanthi]
MKSNNKDSLRRAVIFMYLFIMGIILIAGWFAWAQMYRPHYILKIARIFYGK